MYVEEKDRSWCTDSRENDNRAVTIEVASDDVYPYTVNSKAYGALIQLLADICKRNEIKRLLWKGDSGLIGQVDKQDMTVHRWFNSGKSCPGDYLFSLHYQIAAEVNKRLEDGDDMTKDETLQMIKQEMDRRDPTYNLLSEVPEYWREDIGELITLGVIRGAGGGKLALTKTKAWCAVVLKRALEANDKIYKTINDVPEWGRPYVQARMDAGTLTGQKTGADGNVILNIRESTVRLLKIISDQPELINTDAEDADE